MSSVEKENRPKSFGERFRDQGLIGAFGKKSASSKPDPNAMHFLDHLEELRWVIFKGFAAFLIGCVSIAIFMQDSVKILQVPLIKAVDDIGEISIDLQSIGLEQYIETLEEKKVSLGTLRTAREEQLIEWGISDPHHQTRILAHFDGGNNRNLLQVIRSYSPIFIAMKICFLGGLGISLPMILYFVGGFVVPGLTKQEKRVFFPGCVAATFLFLAGVSMTYFFILPLSLAFTIEFSFNVLGLDVYRPEAGNYYSTVIWMTFAVGVAFQFPLVLILLVRIGILSVSKLRESRRIVLVILMVSAALITPGGDPVSLCILTIPLYILYELAILTGSVMENRKRIKEWNDWDVQIQGPRPVYPASDKGARLFYFLVAVVLLSLLFVGLKYQDSLRKGLDFSWDEESKRSLQENNGTSLAKQRITEDMTESSAIPNEYFFIELTPAVDENSSVSGESNATGTRLFKGLIIEK